MKNIIILILTVTTIMLGAVCVVQSRKSANQQTRAAALQGELEAASQQLEALQAAQKRADQQRHELMGQAEELAAQLQARQLVETNVTAPAPPLPPPVSETGKADAEKGGLGKMLSKMMQDPDTKKFIQQQQRMMMDQMYGPLVKQLGLTPEEATQFKDMLVDNGMKAAEKATSVFGGDGSTNRTEMLSSLTTEQKSFDDQVKAFLGDAKYAQYKDYQDTVGERALLTQFKQQAGNDYNLSDPQSEALLTFMKEEKKSVAASTGLPLGDSGQDPAKLQSLMSDDKVDQYMQAQETINQRVYDRARTILSPEQLATLGRFQTNQLQMMRMGMGMMKTMFGPDKTSGGAASPGQ
jgi:phage terminase small subunit